MRRSSARSPGYGTSSSGWDRVDVVRGGADRDGDAVVTGPFGQLVEKEVDPVGPRFLHDLVERFEPFRGFTRDSRCSCGNTRATPAPSARGGSILSVSSTRVVPLARSSIGSGRTVCCPLSGVGQPHRRKQAHYGGPIDIRTRPFW